MQETKLISIRVNASLIEALDKSIAHNWVTNRSYYLNKMIEFGMALMESHQSDIFKDFCYSRGDEIQIHDYDIKRGDWSNSKNK